VRAGIRPRGFTLIELLVVLVILGCLVGLAVLGTGVAGPARKLSNEADQLAGVIGALAEEAVLDNREYGLRLSRDAYQVLRYDEFTGEWQPVGKPHQLPAWASIEYQLEGQPLALPSPKTADEDAEEDEDKPATDSNAPQLLILSSGEISPFRLRLSVRDDARTALQLSSDGFRLPRVETLQAGGRSG
jgi:general secretion pathway protein H